MSTVPFLDRRRFLALAGLGGAGALASPALGALLGWMKEAAASPVRWREAEFYKRLPNKEILCYVCPFDCHLFEDEMCRCRTRTNIGGKLMTPAWENPCIIRVDPVEKMPLNHFLPGEEQVSVAVGGCMLRCLYCQNWQQSQRRPQTLRNFNCTASEAVGGVLRRGENPGADGKPCRTIGFTYTEPIAWLEYAKAVGTYAKKKKVRVVMASSMFFKEKALRDTCRYVDAFAAALKGWGDLFYHKVVGTRDPAEKHGDFKAVLRALEVAREEGVWMEITNLLVPTYNDDMKKIRQMCRWIVKNLGADVPLHFGRFVPEFKLKNLPRTPVATLEEARNIGLEEGIRFVYTSNIAPHVGNNTYCPRCGAKVVSRLGFKILSNCLKDGACPKCGETFPGIWS
jgi:pyruvate formate lyase activating enzyme